MLVYRSSKHEQSTSDLRSALIRVLSAAARAPSAEMMREALLRAGELECGVTDLLSPFDVRARVVAHLTDTVAGGFLSGDMTSAAHAQLAAMRLPERVVTSEPEGFAFYGLDPRAYADRAHSMPCGSSAAVIGIRSIGTTLSAVVSASLRQRGIDSERITVRPTGHPWNRTLVPSPKLVRWIWRWASRGAQFVIVDEGPGLSGSTIAAVMKALEDVGIPASRVTVLCSRAPAPDSFVSEAAQAYWRKHTPLVAAAGRSPRGTDASAGAWRWYTFGPDRSVWPACWEQVERAKFLSHDSRWLFKFEGFPPYSNAALERAEELTHAGFAPATQYADGGMVRMPWLRGRPPLRADLERGALERIADYCAFRTHAFPVANANTKALSEMVDVNVREALGIEAPLGLSLSAECPVMCDARMQPHKWHAVNGHYVKLDGHLDGDGHLLPGPCDIAWDIAGAIVEWQMDDTQVDALIRRFEHESGERVRRRLPDYRLAYCAYRVGAMTLASLSASVDEAPRVHRARAFYRSLLEQQLRARDLCA